MTFSIIQLSSAFRGYVKWWCNLIIFFTNADAPTAKEQGYIFPNNVQQQTTHNLITHLILKINSSDMLLSKSPLWFLFKPEMAVLPAIIVTSRSYNKPKHNYINIKIIINPEKVEFWPMTDNNCLTDSCRHLQVEGL